MRMSHLRALELSGNITLLLRPVSSFRQSFMGSYEGIAGKPGLFIANTKLTLGGSIRLEEQVEDSTLIALRLYK
jgi:hypothetical protein